MNTSSVIQYALTMLGISQKKLAKKLEVSEAQITKWKNNEHMSDLAFDRICNLVGASKGTDLSQFLVGTKIGDVNAAYNLETTMQSMLSHASQEYSNAHKIDVDDLFPEDTVSYQFATAIDEIAPGYFPYPSAHSVDEITRKISEDISDGHDVDYVGIAKQEAGNNGFFTIVELAFSHYADMHAFKSTYIDKPCLLFSENILDDVEPEQKLISENMFQLAISYAIAESRPEGVSICKDKVAKLKTEIRKSILYIIDCGIDNAIDFGDKPTLLVKQRNTAIFQEMVRENQDINYLSNDNKTKNIEPNIMAELIKMNGKLDMIIAKN